MCMRLPHASMYRVRLRRGVFTCVGWSSIYLYTLFSGWLQQEAQLPQRNSASAAHMEGGGLGPPAESPSSPSGYTYAYHRIRNLQQTYVKRAVH